MAKKLDFSHSPLGVKSFIPKEETPAPSPGPNIIDQPKPAVSMPQAPRTMTTPKPKHKVKGFNISQETIEKLDNLAYWGRLRKNEVLPVLLRFFEKTYKIDASLNDVDLKKDI